MASLHTPRYRVIDKERSRNMGQPCYYKLVDEFSAGAYPHEYFTARQALKFMKYGNKQLSWKGEGPRFKLERCNG